MDVEIIIGRHPIIEALRAGRPLNRIVIAQGLKAHSVDEIRELARERGVPLQFMERKRLDAMACSKAHQGFLAHAASKEYVEVEELFNFARQKKEAPFLVALDHLEDPGNLGSILRSGEATGVHGVVFPRRRNVQLTESVAKSSAGAIERVPVARVGNLVQFIQSVKKDTGCWVVGLDPQAKHLYYEVDLSGSLVLVTGSEGRGLSRIVAENCDVLIKLPMKGMINSLNAAVATGVVLYEALRQRTEKRKNESKGI